VNGFGCSYVSDEQEKENGSLADHASCIDGNGGFHLILPNQVDLIKEVGDQTDVVRDDPNLLSNGRLVGTG
jgi:hypothetical protein